MAAVGAVLNNELATRYQIGPDSKTAIIAQNAILTTISCQAAEGRAILQDVGKAICDA